MEHLFEGIKVRQADPHDHLRNFSDRVKKAQKRDKSPAPHKGRGTLIGMAYRLSVELVVGVSVGGFIGWWLDKWFATAPIFFLLMLILGMVAGILNVIRAARAMQDKVQLDDESQNQSQSENENKK
ncbi:MAG: AtpZ/AtpI family protein [Alphaproteobacteria bacterium]|nr:AtpZ/AtpI family protein [Alphaproteobacteria bacterium]